MATRATRKNGRAGRQARRAAAVVAGTAALWLPMRSAGAASPPQPTYGTATVDGSLGEWSGGDVFDSLASNDPPHDVLASASLRYDCDTGVLYVAVAAADGVVLQTIDPAEDYVRLGAGGKIVDGLSGNDGSAPDFAFVGQTADGASGWEASAAVAEGSYPAELRIHAKVPDQSSDGYEVIDLQPRYRDLTIKCPEVLGVTSTTATTTPAVDDTTTTSTTTVGDPVVLPDEVEAPAAAPVEGSPSLTG